MTNRIPEINVESIERTENKKEVSRENDLISIKRIQKYETFTELAEDWTQLTCAAGVPIYSSFEWLSCWWKHFGQHPKRTLFILTVYYDRQLIGIAPFYMGESSVGPVTLQRRLHLMGSGVSQNELFGFIDDYGYSDFLDIIAHPDFEDIVADSILKVLLENKMMADVICFQHVSDESFTVRKILSLLKKQRQNYLIEQTDECPFITLPDSMETYMDEIGSSSRRRRFRKNLEPAGEKYQVTEASTPEKVRRGVDKLKSLHQERWQTLGYPGLFFDTRYHDFFKEISEIAFKKDWLWFKMAKDEEGCAAIRWVLKFNNRFYDCVSGFDPSTPSSTYSPGLGLLANLIDDGIEKNISRIELLRGAERYKFDFTRESRYNWRISLPLYEEKSIIYSFLNKLMNTAGRIFAFLENETELLHVHRQKKGFFNTIYSYGSFQVNRLTAKLKDLNTFSKKGQ